MNSKKTSETNRPQPIVLLGAEGMLGQAWAQLLNDQSVSFEALGREEIDITNADSVAEAIGDDVRLVINCAAFTDVDGAESARSKAFAANAKGSRHVAKRCADIGATMVHYSTDYVFNGKGSEPYPVDHKIQPVNVYGESKAAGESAIRETGVNHLIIRTSWLYAPWGNNFVRTMLKLTDEKSMLKVVDDQVGRPTSATQLAASTLKLIDAGSAGTFHLTDGGQCSWFEFTKEIARLAGHDCDIQPCTSEEFPRPAKRPAYSVLDLSEAEKVVGEIPDWKQSLAEVVKQVDHVA